PASLGVQATALAAADAHVDGGNVDIGPNVTIQSSHKALAEAHDLSVGLTGGIKVAAALAAADGQAGQAVLEDLLKAQELDDAGVHIGLEAQAALVGADGAVKLAAITDVGVIVAVIVHPHHTEGKHTLRLYHAVEQVSLLIFRMLVYHGGDRGEHLFNGLDKLGLVAVL